MISFIRLHFRNNAARIIIQFHTPSSLRVLMISQIFYLKSFIYLQNYQLMRVHLRIIVALLFIVQVIPIARSPLPHCNLASQTEQYFIQLNELMSKDISDIFSGYNLEVRLGSVTPWAIVSSKQNILDQSSQNYPNIISHYIEPKEQSIGNATFILYKHFTGYTFFSYGAIKNTFYLPKYISTITVTIDKDVTCFDAVLFFDQNTAIVDCTKKAGSAYRNYFYILDLKTNSVKKMVENDLYVDFKSLTRRKLLKLSLSEAQGFTYIIRSYFSDGVDESHNDNTYLQIFMAPLEDLSLIKRTIIVNRGYLKQPSLKIMDVEIYHNDIFLLDESSGLYQFHILSTKSLLTVAHYKSVGFTKFGMYMTKDRSMIVALSNRSSVIEVSGWENPYYQTIVNKYSLMENSNIKNIFLNDQYLVVVSSTEALNGNNQRIEVYYTWILKKGSRTYLNAYHVIQHKSALIQVNFDRELSHIYIAEQQGLSLRQISASKLNIKFQDQKLLGSKGDIIVLAESSDFYSRKIVRCEQKITVSFINEGNMTIFSDTSILNYTSNYPSSIKIPLSSYCIGPNLQYSIINAVNTVNNLPTTWIQKINTTTMKMKTTADIIFFKIRSQYSLRYRDAMSFYFYQEASNMTNLGTCSNYPLKEILNCTNVFRIYNFSSKIKLLTTSPFNDNFFTSIVLSSESNIVYMFNLEQTKINIRYESGPKGQVTSLASSANYLYVLRKEAKTIDVYSYDKCSLSKECTTIFSITEAIINQFGIDNVTILDIITNPYHPDVLFIKMLGCILIIDANNPENLRYLSYISSSATASIYTLAVSQNRLLVATVSNSLQLFSLKDLYMKKTVYLIKTLSTNGMTLYQTPYIIFSVCYDLAYISAYDPLKNVTVILVYKTLSSGNSLYATVILDKFYSINQINVQQIYGCNINFVTILVRGKLQVYKVSAEPFLVVKEVTSDLSFKIKAYNSKSSFTTDQLKIEVVNKKQLIQGTKSFNQKVKKFTASKIGTYEWTDRQWFIGNRVNYEYSCEDCHKGQASKVKFQDHIDNYRDIHVGSGFFQQTLTGGFALNGANLVRFKLDGSVGNIYKLPVDSLVYQYPERVAAEKNQKYVVSAYHKDGANSGTNLYVTFLDSNYTWGPYLSKHYYLQTLSLIDDVIMAANTPYTPEYFSEPGQIYLYQLKANVQKTEIVLMEVIDSLDFLGCGGWNQTQAYFGGAHMVYAQNTNAHRLYISQARYGFFVMDFTKNSNQQKITVLATSFVNVKAILQNNGLYMPSNAVFLAIKFNKIIRNLNVSCENLVLTTKGYHNFEITVCYDDAGYVKNSLLHRLYRRYSFYQAYNRLQVKDGFIVTGYVLQQKTPYPDLNYTKQYVVVYDSLDYPLDDQKGYSDRQIMAAIPAKFGDICSFAINSTLDSQLKKGVIVSLPIQSDWLSNKYKLIGASISRNLTLRLERGYKTQKVEVKAYNDFSSLSFNISLTNSNQLQEIASQKDSKIEKDKKYIRSE